MGFLFGIIVLIKLLGNYTHLFTQIIIMLAFVHLLLNLCMNLCFNIQNFGFTDKYTAYKFQTINRIDDFENFLSVCIFKHYVESNIICKKSGFFCVKDIHEYVRRKLRTVFGICIKNILSVSYKSFLIQFISFFNFRFLYWYYRCSKIFRV